MNTSNGNTKSVLDRKSIESANEKARKVNSKNIDLSDELFDQVKKMMVDVVPKNDYTSDDAELLFMLHTKYLSCFYKDITKEYHLAMATIYAEDERFIKLYNDIVPGGAEYLSTLIKRHYL